MMTGHIHRLLSPQSVAVVGASDDLSKAGGQVVANILGWGFSGQLALVNPLRDSVQGVSSHNSLRDLEWSPDIVVVALPAPLVGGAVEDAAEIGAKTLVVFSSGFGELDSDGSELEEDLRETLRTSGIRLVGPNCLGLLIPHQRACLSWSHALGGPDKIALGDIAIVSQSGAVGVSMLHALGSAGVGISAWITTGNELDLTFGEYLKHLAGDEQTHHVAGYVEAIKDIASFMEGVDALTAAGKELVLMPGGLSQTGAKAAASHTGALMRGSKFYEDIFRQVGAITCSTFEEIVPTIQVLNSLSHTSKYTPASIVVAGNSGGWNVMVADASETVGLTMPDVTDRQIQSYLPEFVSVANPLDFSNMHLRDSAAIGEVISRLAELGLFDICVLSFVGLSGNLTARASQLIATIEQAAEASQFLVLVSLIESDYVHDGAESSHYCLVGNSPTAFVRALGRICAARKLRTNEAFVLPYRSGGEVSRRQLSPEPRRLERRPEFLSEFETKMLLKKAGLPVISCIETSSVSSALTAAQTLGYPVGLKLNMRGLLHKTDIDGLRLNLEDSTDVANAYAELIEVVHTEFETSSASQPSVIVESMAASPVAEAIVSLRKEEGFGVILMCGTGGEYVEILRDVAYRVLPVDQRDVRSMISQLNLLTLLQGRRKPVPGDIEGFVEFVCRVSALVHARPEIAELELNPVFVFETGKGVTVVDALCQLTSADAITEM